MDWRELGTPLGLPGQRQAVCSRTSFIPLRPGMPAKKSERRFYATDLPRHRPGADRLREFIREHWGIENRLHHVRDRTWLEDRHWVANKRTGAIVKMLRSVACAAWCARRGSKSSIRKPIARTHRVRQPAPATGRSAGKRRNETLKSSWVAARDLPLDHSGRPTHHGSMRFLVAVCLAVPSACLTLARSSPKCQ